jgi:hypothetical protein
MPHGGALLPIDADVRVLLHEHAQDIARVRGVINWYEHDDLSIDGLSEAWEMRLMHSVLYRSIEH